MTKPIDTEDAVRINLAKLPHLGDVFQAFLRGRHISNEDFGLYHEVQDHETAYEALLAALGYELIADRRGYYYLIPRDGAMTMNATTQKMALAVFVLIDLLADLGRDPVHVLTRGSLEIGEIAAAMDERCGELLREGGIPGADGVAKLFSTVFRRLGFATINGNTLRFRPPIHRFLDVCEEVGRSAVCGTDGTVDDAGGALERLRRINFPARKAENDADAPDGDEAEDFDDDTL